MENASWRSGYNALTGARVRLGRWDEYLAMRDGILELNARYRNMLSTDLGAVEGLLFDVGTKRYPLRDEESAVAWFYRVLRNAIVDYYRRATVERRVVGDERNDAEQAPDFDEELERAACACVLAAAESLRPEYAEILRQVDVGGTTPEAFARGHGLAGGNARVRLHRARRALRREVEQICQTCAEHGCLDCTCKA